MPLDPVTGEDLDILYQEIVSSAIESGNGKIQRGTPKEAAAGNP